MKRDSLVDYFRNKKILITGGAGSIGAALTKKILTLNVKKVRILDNNESALIALERNLKSPNLEIFLGDIRDKECIREAVAEVDIIFHAAALKHVPLSEYYPFEYVKTNVLGTQNLIEAALEECIEKFILISTDKAVNPVNVMGATKLLAERLTIAASIARRNHRTIFSCVRFGNVLYTRGSVLEIFLEQIRRGGPLTITDPKMTRFIMSINKAVDLVLKATYYAKGGEIFILKMNSVRIIDLAKAFVEVMSPRFGLSPERIEIKIIGRRPGEKMHEELMTESEAYRAIEMDDMFIVYPELLKQPKIVPRQYKQYTSRDAKLLDKNSIKRLIKEFFEFYDIIILGKS